MDSINVKKQLCFALATLALCINSAQAAPTMRQLCKYAGIATVGISTLALKQVIQNYQDDKTFNFKEFKATLKAVFTNQKQLWKDDKTSLLIADATIATLAIAVGSDILTAHANAAKTTPSKTLVTLKKPVSTDQHLQGPPALRAHQVIQRARLFEQTFGVTETAYKADRSLLPVQIDAAGNSWICPIGRNPICCGKFREISISIH